MLLSTIIRSQYLSPHPLWVVSSSVNCLIASLSRHHALTSPTRHSLSYPPTSATMPHATYSTMASLHIIEKTIILALFSHPLPKSAHVLPTMRLPKPPYNLVTSYQSVTYHFGFRPHEGHVPIPPFFWLTFGVTWRNIWAFVAQSPTIVVQTYCLVV